MKNLIKYTLPLILIWANGISAEDQRIAVISKNKSYFCRESSRSLLIKTFTPEGIEKSVKELSDRKALKLRKEIVKEIKSLKKNIKLETSNRKKNKLEQQLTSKQLIRDGIKKCLNSTLTFESEINLPTAPLPLDLVIPPTYDSENTIASGSFPGECELKGKYIPAYQGNSDQALVAPQSGQLFCQFSTSEANYQSLLLKVFKKGNPKEIIFTKTIDRNDINEDLSFTVVLCPEFPGCFNANIVAKTISEGGIDISLEKYPVE